MATELDDSALLPPVKWLSEEEWQAFFEESVREMLGISSDEFIRRWKAGEWDGIADTSEHWDTLYLAMLGGFDR